MAPLRFQCASTPRASIPQTSLPEDAAIAVLVGRAAVLARVSGGSLLECFAAVGDPRDRRGVRHALPSILGLCTAAVLAGCVTLAEITGWIAAADQELLAAVGCRRGTDGRCTPPHPDTVERVVALLGAQGLADGVGGYLAGKAEIGCVGAPIAGPVVLPAIAVDGKAMRGAIGPDGAIPYLLAAATHGESVVVAERLIGAKTNEVPEFQPLLRALPVGVGGCVFTMDAAHTVRAHARFITEELLAHYVMIVKQNQKGLFDRLDGLDWAGVPITHEVSENGHGRRERRTIQVLDAPDDLGFPHAAQVFLIERYTPARSVSAPREAASTRRSRSTPRSRCSGSPACLRERPHRCIWPATCAGTGRSRTRSTGFGMSHSVRTLLRSKQAPGLA